VSNLPPSQTVPTIYQINPRLHSPYVPAECGKRGTATDKIANVTVSYLNSRGVHQFLSVNANAPLPEHRARMGRDPSDSGNIYQYASEGIFKQNQLIANFNIRAGAKLTLFGFYSLNTRTATSQASRVFLLTKYNLNLDYGRASYDTRHRIIFGGSVIDALRIPIESVHDFQFRLSLQCHLWPDVK